LSFDSPDSQRWREIPDLPDSPPKPFSNDLGKSSAKTLKTTTPAPTFGARKGVVKTPTSHGHFPNKEMALAAASGEICNSQFVGNQNGWLPSRYVTPSGF
jgi:hypothetical protein